MPSGYLVPRGCDQHGERQQLEGMWSADSKGAEEPLSSLVCSVLKNGKIAARDGAWCCNPEPNPSKEAEGSPLSPCPAASGIYHGRASPQFCSSFHLSQQSVPALAPKIDLELR